MNRVKLTSLVVIAAIACLAVTGCSPTSMSADNKASGTKLSPALSEAQLKAKLIGYLRQDCTSLSSFVLTPSTWVKSGSNGDSVEFSTMGGDGGQLVLNVVPDGAGGANVTIADSNFSATNALLWSSGCKTLATDPNQGAAGSNSDSTSSGSQGTQQQQSTGHNQQECITVAVPNPNYYLDGSTDSQGSTIFEPRTITQQQCHWVWVNN